MTLSRRSVSQQARSTALLRFRLTRARVMSTRDQLRAIAAEFDTLPRARKPSRLRESAAREHAPGASAARRRQSPYYSLDEDDDVLIQRYLYEDARVAPASAARTGASARAAPAASAAAAPRSGASSNSRSRARPTPRDRLAAARALDTRSALDLAAAADARARTRSAPAPSVATGRGRHRERGATTTTAAGRALFAGSPSRWIERSDVFSRAFGAFARARHGRAPNAEASASSPCPEQAPPFSAAPVASRQPPVPARAPEVADEPPTDDDDSTVTADADEAAGEAELPGDSLMVSLQGTECIVCYLPVSDEQQDGWELACGCEPRAHSECLLELFHRRGFACPFCRGEETQCASRANDGWSYGA